MFLPAFALLFVQDKTETKGKSNAQILAMGRSKWHRFFVGKELGVTYAESGAAGLYGDALAERNDRLDKARSARLRKALQAVRNDSLGVGTALTGGGTMWSIIGSSLYADQEEAIYAVLSKSGKAPSRRVSDVDRAYASLKDGFAKSPPEGEGLQAGRAALARLRKSLDLLIAQAARLPRKGSDAILDFAVNAVGSGAGT